MAGNSPKKKRRGERADGRILVTLVIGTDEQGKTVRKYFYGNTREEAVRKRDRYKREREMGISDLGEQMTVKEWIDIWYQKYKPNLDSNSARNYQALMKRLKARIGEKFIRTVSESDLQSALYDIAGMSSSTIDKYHSLIHQVFSKAFRNRLIPYDPSDDLELPNGYKGTHRALERWETNLILEHWQDHRAGIWAMLMLLLGIRRGEMIALDWSDIDMVKRRVTIHRSAVIDSNQSIVNDKTKTPAGVRVLPICKPLWDALNQTPEDRRTGLICMSSSGGLITGSAFKRGWDGFNLCIKRILNNEPTNQQGRRTDLEKDDVQYRRKFSIKAHDLRHTFATALYDAGVSVKAAQYYLGHADLRMTLDLYTHLSEEREKRERIELTNFLDGWLTPIDADPENGSGQVINISEVES